MARLSACLIVKNEELLIERCLNSLVPFCDEIVVVDTGSTDRTKELASRIDKVKLLDFKWIFDYSAARNFSFKNATSDYIMWVDADEYFPKEVQDCINEWKLADFYGYDIINAQIRFGADSVVWRDRIYRSAIDPHWQYNIHEELVVEGNRGALPLDMIIIHDQGERGSHFDNYQYYYYKALNEGKFIHSHHNDYFRMWSNFGRLYSMKERKEICYDFYANGYPPYDFCNYKSGIIQWGLSPFPFEDTTKVTLVSMMDRSSENINAYYQYLKNNGLDEDLEIFYEFLYRWGDWRKLKTHLLADYINDYVSYLFYKEGRKADAMRVFYELKPHSISHKLDYNDKYFSRIKSNKVIGIIDRPEETSMHLQSEIYFLKRFCDEVYLIPSGSQHEMLSQSYPSVHFDSDTGIVYISSGSQPMLTYDSRLELEDELVFSEHTTPREIVLNRDVLKLK